ncbi:MAG: hypothetical protein M1826_000112 [Phylliscum demangeonii]|nr:MAG: hypothetical protein M1826_000112 [Phylliscum demangeonii]
MGSFVNMNSELEHFQAEWAALRAQIASPESDTLLERIDALIAEVEAGKAEVATGTPYRYDALSLLGTHASRRRKPKQYDPLRAQFLAALGQATESQLRHVRNGSQGILSTLWFELIYNMSLGHLRTLPTMAFTSDPIAESGAITLPRGEEFVLVDSMGRQAFGVADGEESSRDVINHLDRIERRREQVALAISYHDYWVEVTDQELSRGPGGGVASRRDQRASDLALFSGLRLPGAPASRLERDPGPRPARIVANAEVARLKSVVHQAAVVVGWDRRAPDPPAPVRFLRKSENRAGAHSGGAGRLALRWPLQMPEYEEERHLWEAVFPLVYGKLLDELAAEQVAEIELRGSKKRMALADDSEDETPLAPA